MATLALPNPLTPLAWLPLDIANELEASRYLYCATVGAWIWDCLMSLSEEWHLFTKRKLSLSDVVYILSRIASGSFIITSLVFQVAPVGDCHALAKAIGWCGAFAMPLNSLLFFFRVRAVFNQNNFIVILFGLLWLATLGCISAPFAVDGIHIGTTRNCVNSNVKAFSSAGIIIIGVHDTLVYVAITTRLTIYSLADTWPARIRAFFSGQGMNNMSKAVLMTGQLYYAATVGMNIVALSVILSPSVPPVIRAMFSIPNVALQNAMACRVFRQLKLGLISERITTASASRGTAPIQLMPTVRSNMNSKNYPNNSQTDVESVVLHHTSSFRNQKSIHVDINKETDVSVDPISDSRDTGDWKAGDFA